MREQLERAPQAWRTPRGRQGPARASIRAAGRMVGSEEPWRGLQGQWEVTLSHPLQEELLHFTVYKPLPSSVTAHLLKTCL